MKRIVSFFTIVIIAIVLVGCKSYSLKIVGPTTVEKDGVIVLEVETNYKDPIVEWSSDANNIARIDEGGKVFGLEIGTAIITAKVEKVGSAEVTITVVAPSLPAYTPAQLKDLFTNLRNEYSSAKNGHVKLEASAGQGGIVTELKYNFGTDEINSLMYKLSGEATAHVYVKDNYAYMFINDVKSKTEMTETEHTLIMESYGFDKYSEEALAFIDELEFYQSITFDKKQENTLIYNLNLATYDGVVFNVDGKDKVSLYITFEEEQIVEVEFKVFVGTTESNVKMYFFGTAIQSITYPTDLDSYE